METQKVVISDNFNKSLTEELSGNNYDRLFVLCDSTTERECLPIAGNVSQMKNAKLITIKPTDSNKDLNAVQHVWSELQSNGATRHSLMVNLGGGMVTDLGGFAASTFKRGIGFINIPTTLLAMVDASVGGKTGINLGGLKNEIGVFSNARSVIIDSVFLKTLDNGNMLSGFAEMLKHGLIDSTNHWAELLNSQDNACDTAAPIPTGLIARSIAVKQRIVTEDPLEHGLRKALNLGHTVGHAFESLALRRSPVLHGYAVAWGLVCELYLSAVKCGFPTDKLHQTTLFIKEHYGKMAITCNDYPTLLQLMTHDKKNVAGQINFTLLGNIGDIRINQTCTADDICEALDFYREC